MIRAFCQLEVKDASNVHGKRVFSGIASTPTPDLSGDVMDPHGAIYKLPLPFLWQHDSKQPIGWITKASASSRGIEVEGEVAQIEPAGPLKDRVDTAWQSLRSRLVRGLSIGFVGIDAVPLPRGGTHFKKWQWIELSGVTIPMNLEATIVAIKAADAARAPAVLAVEEDEETPEALVARIAKALDRHAREAQPDDRAREAMLSAPVTLRMLLHESLVLIDGNEKRLAKLAARLAALEAR